MREIAITCKGIDTITLDEIVDFQGNLKKITKDNFDKLKKRIIQNGFNVPFFVWETEGKKKLMDGHQRRKVLLDLREEGYIVPPLPYVVIEARDEKDARQKLLGICSQYGEFEIDEFKDWVNDLELDIAESLRIVDKELKNLIQKDDETEKKKAAKVASAEIEDEILQYNRFFISFSGGKDSLLTLFKIVPVLKEYNKQFEVFYIDTGVEFPDLLPYIYKIVEMLDVPFKVLQPRKNFFDLFYKPRVWPKAIYRDCIDLMLTKTVDDYCDDKKEPYVLIRGGRSNQKTSGASGSKKIQRFQTKPLCIIYNPIYDVAEENFQDEISLLPLWPGYAKGFDRTACWCCPFQKTTQWEAMKIHYPLLHEQMGELVKRLAYFETSSDIYSKRIRSYWGDIKTC